MIVCCPRSVLIPCWDPIMGAQRTLFPGQLSTAVLVRRKPLSFLGKHTLRCTAILLEQRKFHVLVFKTYFESEFNNQCIGIWWPVYTNHSFLCTMHSLQSKCTCNLWHSVCCSGLEPASYRCQIPACNGENYSGNIPWDGDDQKSCSYYEAQAVNTSDDTCKK